MASKIECFFVINTNPKTIHPSTGEAFAGQYCYSNGFQVSTIKDATMYWTHKGAQALVNKLTRSNGLTCPGWARKKGATNDGDKTPAYSIITRYIVEE